MSHKIHKRDDVNPEEGIHRHGDVTFADPVNNKYPIDNAQDVRSAWSYINHPHNAAKYSSEDVHTIKERIKRAAKKFDVDIESDKKG